MWLVGSRLLGIENDKSDWDYVMDDGIGVTYKDIVNEYLGEHKHCYHVSREYLDKVSRYQIEDNKDVVWVCNPINYVAGANYYNPFDYKSEWIKKLKNIDKENEYFISMIGKPLKRFWQVVYNLECLKQNTLHPDMTLVKKFHDREATDEEFENVLMEISEL